MFNLCVERHIILGRVGIELLSGAKNKKIIALVDIVLIGKGIDGMVIWTSDIQSCQHSELCIHPSHNFLEYALPFTFMASPVPTIFILVIMQREKGKHIQRAHLCNAMAA